MHRSATRSKPLSVGPLEPLSESLRGQLMAGQYHRYLNLLIRDPLEPSLFSVGDNRAFTRIELLALPDKYREVGQCLRMLPFIRI